MDTPNTFDKRYEVSEDDAAAERLQARKRNLIEWALERGLGIPQDRVRYQDALNMQVNSDNPEGEGE